MLPRLSAQSQELVDRAQVIARQYGQDYVDSEHVLVAIAEKDNCHAGKLLRDHGGKPDVLRKAIQQTLVEPQAETFVTGRLPGTMHFKNVIARAIEAAGSRGAAAVGPEHLLLALASEQGSLALQTLQGLGLDARKIDRICGQE
jgi:ATP-dependent Clp protease ATP-binding subunit ClpC